MQTLRLVPIVFMLAACASSPAPVATTAPVQPVQSANAAVDPVGSYEFSTVVDGQTVTGTVHIEGAPLSYKGRIITAAFPEMPITSVTTEGNVVNVIANLGGGDLLIRMVMDGMNFKGTWAVESDSGEITGRKLAP